MQIPAFLFSVEVVPFIMLITQIVKTAIPTFNTKYSPVVAIALGLVFSFGHLFITHEIDAITAAVWGIYFGFQAIGVYSGVKNVAQAVKASRLARLTR